MICCMHNADTAPKAEYMMLLPIGNEIPLCEQCCQWWRAHAGDREFSEFTQPVRIRGVRSVSASP